MDHEERVAKRMFEAYGRTTTYGMPWDRATGAIKKIWLLMAREALDEMKECGKPHNIIMKWLKLEK